MKLFLSSVSLLLTLLTHAQTTYYSKAGATNFNDVNSWGTATDGTGTAPASISNADVFVIGNSAFMVLTAPANIQSLYIGNFTGFSPATASGRLTVATGQSLTISKIAGNNATLGLGANGRLQVNGGTVLINGNINEVSTGSLYQSGGTIEVDGNDAGNAATSVGSGTPIVLMLGLNNGFDGGTFIITDPHAGSLATDAAFAYTNSVCCDVHNSLPTHIFQLGNGVSTDAGGNATNGFYINQATGSKRFNFGSIVINTVTNSSNRFVTQSAGTNSTALWGDMTITSGEYIIRSNRSLVVGGNLVNNGTLTTEGTLRFAFPNMSGGEVSASTIQNLSGNGVFRNDRVTPSANFGGIDFDNINATGIVFSGTAWNSLPSTISTLLNFRNGRVNIGSSTVVTLQSGINLLWTVGGFINGTVRRLLSTATIATGNLAGMFPFVNKANKSRQFFIGVPTALGTGGSVSITYNEVGGVAAVAPFNDNGAMIANVSNDNWVITQDDLTPASATLQLRIFADGIITHATSNARITAATGTVFGGATSGQSTGQSGTPQVNKTTTTVADIAGAGTNLYFGYSNFFTTAANGNWEDGSTWVGGVSPGLSCDDVVISHTVTVEAVDGSCGYLESRGNLKINGATLTVGCTNNNTKFLATGQLNVSGGVLKINGYLTTVSLATCKVNQSGGQIIIDGNNGGSPVGSVQQGVPLCALYNSNSVFTGGKIIIVDPHPGGGVTDYAFEFSSILGPVTSSAAHTIQFGDGISTDPGNPLIGFLVKCQTSSGSPNYFRPGNLVVNAGNLDSRAVSHVLHLQINNDLQILSGRFTNPTSLNCFVAGSILNNGNLISSGFLYMGNAANAGLATTNAQTIGGAGVFANAAVGATANMNYLTINNTNSNGVTLNVPLSVGTSFSLTNGVVNTSGSNLLTLGRSDATGGSLSYTTGRINGPFKRNITTAIGARQFPVGNSTLLKNASINYTAAPSSAGFLTAEWIAAAPGTNGLPLTEGAITIQSVSDAGFWRISASGGLAGGTYTGTFTGSSTPGITDVTKLVLLKRNDAVSPWQLNGTHIIGSGTIANPVVARSGMTGFSEFGIGLPDAALPLTTSWTGAADTDWFNAGNWSNGVPGTITAVTIPTGKPRYPLIGTNTSVKSVTIENAAAVNVVSGVNLIITGN